MALAFHKHANMDCDEIVSGLFVGSHAASVNVEQLNALGITHLLCCASEIEADDDEFVRMKISADDDPIERIGNYFDQCRVFIDGAREQSGGGGKVLVYCQMGISRSVTIATSYLMMAFKMRWIDALNLVQERRPVANPNAGFRAQLVQLDERLNASS